jgi:hypothetical protein
MDRRKTQCISWFARNRRSRKEHLKYTLNWTKSVETGSEGERGWNPLGITKQGEEEPQITKKSPRAPVGEERGRKGVECG